MTSVQPLAARFREHAAFCDRAGAPLYRELLLGLAADLEAGGPVAAVLAGRLDAPTGDVVQLRLLAALHRLVLTGRAPQLEPFYRSAPRSPDGAAPGPALGPADPRGAWPVAREVLRGRVEPLRQALDRVPQTNETGRSVALAVGLAALAGLRAGDPDRAGPLRVRLLELGSSAGLNLLVDRYRVEGGWAGRPWAWGPAGSPLRLADAVRTGPDAGPVPEPGGVVLVERAGCDLHPVDPLTPEGALHRSFVWPDHTDRRARLEAALAVARAAGPDAAPVERAGAADWLAGRLAVPAAAGVVTVVWHSVVLQYLPEPERDRLDAVLAEAAGRMPLHRLSLESAVAPYTSDPVVRLDDRVLAVSSAHGLPVRLGAGGPGVR